MGNYKESTGFFGCRCDEISRYLVVWLEDFGISTQTPRYPAYDNRIVLTGFSKTAVSTEVDGYERSLRSAVRVVTPGITTVAIEAMSSGVPVIAVAFDRSHE